MANNSLIGILINGESAFDKDIKKMIVDYITGKAESMRECGMPVNMTSLAKVLGVRRRRLVGNARALGVMDIFDPNEMRKELRSG
jgi:RNase P/RNase MRP subunit p30